MKSGRERSSVCTAITTLQVNCHQDHDVGDRIHQVRPISDAALATALIGHGTTRPLKIPRKFKYSLLKASYLASVRPGMSRLSKARVAAVT